MSKAAIVFSIFVAVLVGTLAAFVSQGIFTQRKTPPAFSPSTTSQVQPFTSPSPTPETLLTTPVYKLLPGGLHVFQTFNNCGPAALSMLLSYYGFNVTQQQLGQELRPYQHPKGDNDDKSVTLEELAEKSKEYGLIPFHRSNGRIELIKQFITYDMPVVTRTLTKPTEDIGHYRVIKGFDDTSQQLIQDDSLQGRNLRFSYEAFNKLWQQFNFEYLILVSQDKKAIAETILGEEADSIVAWRNTVRNTKQQLINNPDNTYVRFNLSVALYYVGDYQRSVAEFEKVEGKLPFRTLWYQIEPIQAYFELGNFDRVFQLTDKILNNHNRAFSELYLIRGEIYRRQGNQDHARAEFEKALFYNKSLKSAQDVSAQEVFVSLQ